MTSRRAGDEPGAEARRLAAGVVRQVAGGARTNVELSRALADSGLDSRDRAFATELANGSVRMQRACDHFIDRHVQRPPDDVVRALLRVGVYQLVFLATPPHAAVSATVAAAVPRVRGFVNAVLRRVADDVERGGQWPTLGVELSYPDWFIDRAIEELGDEAAIDALRAMNDPEQPAARADGYVQGAASAAVAAEVDAAAGETVIDLCAAPGGKTTSLAQAGAFTIGAEIDAARSRVLATTCGAHGAERAVAIQADATRPPFPDARADRVLVDAPCSGWGALGRRSDARWRLRGDDVPRLARLQSEILAAAAELVKPGGLLVYSVCTFSELETLGVASRFAAGRDDLESEPLLHPDAWRPIGGADGARGGLQLPQDHGSDAMAVFRWRRAS